MGKENRWSKVPQWSGFVYRGFKKCQTNEIWLESDFWVFLYFQIDVLLHCQQVFKECCVGMLWCRHASSLQLFFPLLRTASCRDGPELALFFGLPPDHSTLGLITKTSIPVWSWSHSVRTLTRNMWSCPDTQSEETQSLHSLYFSPFPSPFPPFSHSFLLTLLLASLLGFCPSIFNCAALLLGPLFLYVSLPDIALF